MNLTENQALRLTRYNLADAKSLIYCVTKLKQKVITTLGLYNNNNNNNKNNNNNDNSNNDNRNNNNIQSLASSSKTTLSSSLSSRFC